MVCIKGIRITSLSIGSEDGKGEKIECKYDLVSTTDKILAKQSVNGYDDVKVQPTAATIAAFREAMKLFKDEITTTLGLDAE